MSRRDRYRIVISYIQEDRTIDLKMFGNSKALDVFYASDKEFEEMRPTHDVQSIVCT